MFNCNILIIKSEENIKYLYLDNIKLKKIFIISEITKYYFKERTICSSLEEQPN
jgi:hypothetical protein